VKKGEMCLIGDAAMFEPGASDFPFPRRSMGTRIPLSSQERGKG